MVWNDVGKLCDWKKNVNCINGVRKRPEKGTPTKAWIAATAKSVNRINNPIDMVPTPPPKPPPQRPPFGT